MKRILVLPLAALLLIFALSGCKETSLLDSKDPVTVTMWHNYGGAMQTTMDTLIEQFNSTVGSELGIVVKVEQIASSADLNESLRLIADNSPAAPDCPDIFTGYPKIAVQFAQQGRLVNLDDYMDGDELSAYVDAFVEEGRIYDGGLYVFPIAKSTEVLYVNQTLFDEFASATGADPDKLHSLEGLAELSKQYYEWTDSLTPDIPGDGKDFFAADDWFNLAMVASAQLTDSLFDESGALNLDGKTYLHIFETIYVPATEGGIAVFDGYSSDLSKTGDIVCSTGSSAGILFYGDTITYADTTIRKAEYSILPYPVAEGGRKLALQRGGGLIIAKSDERREYAAAQFIKWLTNTENNMRFISETGYLPVTKQAFETDILAHLDNVKDERIRKMLETVLNMYEEYEFFTAPNFSDYDSVSSQYRERWHYLLNKSRQEHSDGNSISVKETLAELTK